MGGETLRAEFDRTIVHATTQLETTASLIAQGVPALADIPSDRPAYGLIVTLEPYHIVGLARDELGVAPPSIPVAVASISDFERFVADSLVNRRQLAELVAHTDDRRSWDIQQLIARSSDPRYANPMLDDEHQELVESTFRGVRGSP